MSRLTRIFSSVLSIEESQVTPELSPDTTPSWDSLNAIVLVSEIEKAFSIKFSYDEVMSVRTLADAIALIRSKGGDTDM